MRSAEVSPQRLVPLRSAAMAAPGEPGVRRHDPACVRGVVLFEVVLAIALFTLTASIVVGGLGTSVAAVDRLKLKTHAAHLASSVLARLEMGLLSSSEGGERPFPAPYGGWTYEIARGDETDAAGGGGGGGGGGLAAGGAHEAAGSGLEAQLQAWQVIVRYQPDPSIEYRLTQITAASTARQPGEEPAAHESISDAELERVREIFTAEAER